MNDFEFNLWVNTSSLLFTDLPIRMWHARAIETSPRTYCVASAAIKPPSITKHLGQRLRRRGLLVHKPIQHVVPSCVFDVLVLVQASAAVTSVSAVSQHVGGLCSRFVLQRICEVCGYDGLCHAESMGLEISYQLIHLQGPTGTRVHRDSRSWDWNGLIQNGYGLTDISEQPHRCWHRRPGFEEVTVAALEAPVAKASRRKGGKARVSDPTRSDAAASMACLRDEAIIGSWWFQGGRAPIS